MRGPRGHASFTMTEDKMTLFRFDSRFIGGDMYIKLGGNGGKEVRVFFILKKEVMIRYITSKVGKDEEVLGVS